MRIIFVVLLFISSVSVRGQFVSGFGATGGVTLSAQKFRNEPVSYLNDRTFRTRFNGSLFLELLSHENYRIITELQYNQKGSKEKIAGAKLRNGVDYISWNNLFKWRTELYNTVPYLVAGPRLEYLFRTSPAVFPEVINSFRTIHITASVGMGMEYIENEPWVYFGEISYNPDGMAAFRSGNFNVRNNAVEIRVGVKYIPSRGEDCPKVYTLAN